MNPHLLRGLMASLLLLTPLTAQFGDYEWAMALHREYGFDDMAETVFQRMAAGAGSEQQQGKLGLASLKAAIARGASTLDERVALLEEARKLMKDVVDQWADKTTDAYFSAVFELVDVLQQRGEMVMTEVNEKRVAEDQVQKYRSAANDDFDMVQAQLEGLRRDLGSPKPDENREKWRQSNRAWYLQCEALLFKATCQTPETTPFFVALTRCVEETEKFILENETDDEEAFLGALYGYLLKGRAHALKGEPEEALGNFTSILAQNIWGPEDQPTAKLHPAVQALVERAYYHLFDYLNQLKRFEDTLRYGAEMEEKYKLKRTEPKKYGRAAQVLLARARFRQGDMNGALSSAAAVVEDAGGGPSGLLANTLIAEIIAATPDKTQFSPEIIRSAAKGAYIQRREAEKIDQAIRYFRILLQVLDRIPDEEERRFVAAEAHLFLGHLYQLADRPLESAMVCGEGVKQYADVTKDEISRKLATAWERGLRDAAQDTRSPLITKLKSECDQWLAANPIEGMRVSPGTRFYRQGQTLERRAQGEERKNVQLAQDLYAQAAKAYEEAVLAGGPDKERAMSKRARTTLKTAKLLIGSKTDAAQGYVRLAEAKKAAKDYLNYAEDSANKLTDPAYLSARQNAVAEQRYSIAECNKLLLQEEKDAGKIATLNEEIVSTLSGFAMDFEDQKSLAGAALYERLAAELELGRVADADATFQQLKKLAPDHKNLPTAALRLGKHLREVAKGPFDAIVGQAKPDDSEKWDEVVAKSGFSQAQAKMLEAIGYYKEWLLAGKGSQDFSDWNTVGYMYWLAGDFDQAADLQKRAMERFEGTRGEDPAKMLFLKYRQLVALTALAQAAHQAGKTDLASQHWEGCKRLLEALMEKDSKYAKNPRAVRLAALCYGGVVTREQGLTSWHPALNDYSAAIPLWKKLERSYESSAPGSPRFWEAKFYVIHNILRDRKKNKQSTEDLRRLMENLKVVNQNKVGGPVWGPLFAWLEVQM